MKKKLLSLILIFLFSSTVFSAVEDFTTYTEVDENADITVTSTKADVSTMRRDALSYVVSDKGAGHFTTFEHDFTMWWNVGSTYHEVIIQWAVTNQSAPTETSMYGASDGIYILVYQGNYEIILRDESVGDSDETGGDNGLNKVRYISAVRTGSTTNLYI